MKYVIINADDFGYSKIFNKTILELLEKNLIKSTTVMVNWIDLEKQKVQIKKLVDLNEAKKISIGLHLEFTENKNYSFLIQEQFEKFKKIFGFIPSHIDIHKPKYTKEESLSVSSFCQKHNIPCRNLSDEFKNNKTTIAKYANGTEIESAEIENFLDTLENEKTYEILFHPGTFDPECDSSLNKEREKDIEKIEKINNLKEKYNIKIISFKELK